MAALANQIGGAGGLPPGAHRLLLPDARLGLRGRGRRAGDDGPGVAGLDRFEGRSSRAVLAVPHRHQRVPRHAAGPPAPGPADGPRPVPAADERPSARCCPSTSGSCRSPTPASCRSTATRPRSPPPGDHPAGVRRRAAAPAARQRAVLILREVLRWQATEVAELLDTSVASVNSALQRARATLAAASRPPSPAGGRDADQQTLLARYVDAFERYDIDRARRAAARGRRCSRCRRTPCGSQGRETSPWLVGPGHRMPRLAAGRDAANGCPAFGQYAGPAGGHEPWALQVLEISARTGSRGSQASSTPPRCSRLRPARSSGQR